MLATTEATPTFVALVKAWKAHNKASAATTPATRAALSDALTDAVATWRAECAASGTPAVWCATCFRAGHSAVQHANARKAAA